jgi:hypothetical protein
MAWMPAYKAVPNLLGVISMGFHRSLMRPENYDCVIVNNPQDFSVHAK